jgi:hypothetical protein
LIEIDEEKHLSKMETAPGKLYYARSSIQQSSRAGACHTHAPLQSGLRLL